MRLLKLNDDGCFSLAWFPKDKIPPYAILSHTWGRGEDDEVTFEDVINGTGENKMGFQKLRFCGNQAKDDDLHYFWVDTCCINKSDTNELTTAINSMFRWYQNAARCYVYLSDVSVRSRDGKFVHVEWESAFRNSRWFSRGWTLQELLAPKIVDFYSRDHIRLGDKYSLEQQIAGITGIPIEALRGRSLSHFTIEERFVWTEKRQTTMEEDKAYCLLGVFGIFLPLIYGEGHLNAVRRLRREIKESMDTESQPIGLLPSYPGHPNYNMNTEEGAKRTDMDVKDILEDEEPSRRGSEMATPGATVEDVYIAVIGLAGSGKSSLIELITGQGIAVGHGQQQCTETIKSYTFMYGEGLRVHLIEIHGFGDTNRADTDILLDIASWLSATYEKNIRLSGIIYLQSILNIGIRGPARHNLEMFQFLCGTGSFPSFILATTCWDIVEPGIGTSREKELVGREDFWGFMRIRGSVVLRHSGSRQSAMAIVELSLRTRRPFTLQIQREINLEGRSLDDTKAGRQLIEDLLRQRKDHEWGLKVLQVEMNKALKMLDTKMAEVIVERQVSLQKELKICKSYRASLKINRASLLELYNMKRVQS